MKLYLGLKLMMDQACVESRIETDDLDALELGQDMVLTTIDLARGDGEGHFKTFAFKAE